MAYSVLIGFPSKENPNKKRCQDIQSHSLYFESIFSMVEIPNQDAEPHPNSTPFDVRGIWCPAPSARPSRPSSWRRRPKTPSRRIGTSATTWLGGSIHIFISSLREIYICTYMSYTQLVDHEVGVTTLRVCLFSCWTPQNGNAFLLVGLDL